MSKITEAVWKLAEPVAAEYGCKLWDVEFVKEAGEYYLRVYIDSIGGPVGIDQCEAVSKALDPILDRADPIDQSYIFEVSSPGAERALKRPSDFEQFMGSAVTVKLFSPKNGKKEYAGTLTGYEDGTVRIDSGGAALTFAKAEIALVRLKIEF